MALCLMESICCWIFVFVASISARKFSFDISAANIRIVNGLRKFLMSRRQQKLPVGVKATFDASESFFSILDFIFDVHFES
jgi:hypothetical protein